MSKIKTNTENEIYVIHFNGKPLHLVTEKFNEWKPSKKVYFIMSSAKCGMNYIPKSIKESCEIVKYIPEENENNKD